MMWSIFLKFHSGNSGFQGNMITIFYSLSLHAWPIYSKKFFFKFRQSISIIFKFFLIILIIILMISLGIISTFFCSWSLKCSLGLKVWLTVSDKAICMIYWCWFWRRRTQLVSYLSVCLKKLQLFFCCEI